MFGARPDTLGKAGLFEHLISLYLYFILVKCRINVFGSDCVIERVRTGHGKGLVDLEVLTASTNLKRKRKSSQKKRGQKMLQQNHRIPQPLRGVKELAWHSAKCGAKTKSA